MIAFKLERLVLEQISQAHFICPGMLGQPQAEKWIAKLGIENSVSLLPYLPQQDLWALYGRCLAYVSLSSHDGVPNSFIESIALDCFPIMGNIPSIAEWITDGQNGILVNPLNPQEAAQAITQALQNEKLRAKAFQLNEKLINNRADREKNYNRVLDFYQGLLKAD